MRARRSYPFALVLGSIILWGCDSGPQPPPISTADSVAIERWLTCTECVNGELSRVLTMGGNAVPWMASPLQAPTVHESFTLGYEGRTEVNRRASRQMRGAFALTRLSRQGEAGAEDSLRAALARHATSAIPFFRADVLEAVEDAIDGLTPVAAILGLADQLVSAPELILSVTLADADGLLLSGRTVVWSLSDSTSAQVTPTSGTTATLRWLASGDGTVTVTATVDSVGASAEITFVP